MARDDPQQGLMPSILDRLIDPESLGKPGRPGYTLDQVVAALQRDLEDLLNTRQSHGDLPETFVEVRKSVVGYGLPDLTSFNVVTEEQREGIGRVLEQIVNDFEPRLRDVRATMAFDGNTKERAVRFRIEARLCMDPAPEVAFDTILELTTGHYSIEAAS